MDTRSIFRGYPRKYTIYLPDLRTKALRVDRITMDKPRSAISIVQTKGRATRSSGSAAIFPSSSTRLITDIHGTPFVK